MPASSASHRPVAVLGLVFLHDQCDGWFIPQMHGPIHTCTVWRIRSGVFLHLTTTILASTHIQSLCYYSWKWLPPSPASTDLQLYSHMRLLMQMFGLGNQQDEMQIYTFTHPNNVKSCYDERSRARVKVADNQVASWDLWRIKKSFPGICKLFKSKWDHLAGCLQAAVEKYTSAFYKYVLYWLKKKVY